MRALTLWRPWAWCVAHAGKDVENREWRPPERILGQRIAIHAGKRYDREAAEHLYHSGVEVPTESRDPAGAIVAVTTISDWTPRSESPWFGGPIGWCLEDTIALPEPVPCRGAQGLWIVPLGIEIDIANQIDSVRKANR